MRVLAVFLGNLQDKSNCNGQPLFSFVYLSIGINHELWYY
jgi:hypothetical protein